MWAIFSPVAYNVYSWIKRRKNYLQNGKQLTDLQSNVHSNAFDAPPCKGYLLINHLRPSLLVQFYCHERRGTFLVDTWVSSLPEEVRTASSSYERLAWIVTFQRPRTYTRQSQATWQHAGKFEHITSTSLAAGQTTGPVQTGFNNFQRFATQ